MTFQFAHLHIRTFAHLLIRTFAYLHICILVSCSTQKQISRSAKSSVFADSTIKNALIGISIYEVSSGKYLYNHDADKYFVPASNTKIITCYAGLKYLGDSLAGIKYQETAEAIILTPTGDPTLLHPDYQKQPVIDFLKRATKPLKIIDTVWKSDDLGSGWSWDDYNYNYMVERSPLPVYGNILRWTQERGEGKPEDSLSFDQSVSIYSTPEINWKVNFKPDPPVKSFYVQRDRAENVYTITEGSEKKKTQEVPFVTHGVQSALELLKDTIGREIQKASSPELRATSGQLQTIHSQLLDSMLRPMMHRSDNFFAEQTLMMVSQVLLGYMDDTRAASRVINDDLKGIPQRPRWADGSGLSRFNLFTPQDFVFILNKMQAEFGMDRLKNIFPTGGRGTISNYYKSDSGYIFAKTGSLSGVICISGYLYTKKNKLLSFRCWLIIIMGIRHRYGEVLRGLLPEFANSINVYLISVIRMLSAGSQIASSTEEQMSKE